MKLKQILEEDRPNFIKHWNLEELNHDDIDLLTGSCVAMKSKIESLSKGDSVVKDLLQEKLNNLDQIIHALVKL